MRVGRGLFQKFEGVVPIVLEEAGNAPQHAERLGGARGFGFAHVGDFPAELIAERGDGPLRGVVIAADEHGGLAGRESGIDHAGGTDAVIEGFDEFCAGKFALVALHEGIVEIGEKFEDAVDGWGVGDGIGGIDDAFPPSKFFGPAARRASEEAEPLTARTQQFAEFGGVFAGADGALGFSFSQSASF